MKVRMRRTATLLATVVLVAACSSGGARARRRPRRSPCSSSGSPRPSSPATSRRSTRATTPGEGLDVAIMAGAVEIVPATVVASGQAQFGISWVPRMLAPRESGADVVLDRPDLPAVADVAGVVQVGKNHDP